MKVQHSLPPHMEVTGAAYSKVGSALAAFAGDLDGGQDRMSPLAIRARNAWEALSAASAADSRAQLQAGLMREIASRAPAGDTAAGVMSTSASDDAARASGALSAAQSEWDQLVADARRVRDDAREAADRCARIINGAADGKFQENPTGWSGFVGNVQSFIVDHADALKKISGALKIVSAVAGVLSLIPVLNFVAGPIALASAGLALGIDVALKLATGDGSWSEIAVDTALFALPIAGSGIRATRSAGSAASRIKPLTGSAAPATEKAMFGRPANTIVRTIDTSPGSNPQGYVDAVVSHYGINLRGSGVQIEAVFDDTIRTGVAGVTKSEDGGFIIRIGSEALANGDASTANTIAHELSHARYFLKHGTFDGEVHANAYASGDRLEDWIVGKL